MSILYVIFGFLKKIPILVYVFLVFIIMFAYLYFSNVSLNKKITEDKIELKEQSQVIESVKDATTERTAITEHIFKIQKSQQKNSNIQIELSDSEILKHASISKDDASKYINDTMNKTIKCIQLVTEGDQCD